MLDHELNRSNKPKNANTLNNYVWFESFYIENGIIKFEIAEMNWVLLDFHAN